jgi:putative isomerase
MTDAAELAPARLWNTWESDHPAAMRFLPLGLELRPCAYAASRNAFTDFPAMGPGLVLGPRGVTAAEGVRLGLAHGGTQLDWRYGSPEPGTLTGAYRVRKHGEWGLRFWVLLVLRLMPPERRGAPVRWRFDAARGLATASHRGRHVAVGASRSPLLVTVHRSLDALKEEMESKGYWYLESRGSSGPVMALRYNLEEMPELSFAAVVAESAEEAAGKVRALLSPPPQPSPVEGEGEEGRGANSPPPLRGRDREGGRCRAIPLTFWYGRAAAPGTRTRATEAQGTS